MFFTQLEKRKRKKNSPYISFILFFQKDINCNFNSNQIFYFHIINILNLDDDVNQFKNPIFKKEKKRKKKKRLGTSTFVISWYTCSE